MGKVILAWVLVVVVLAVSAPVWGAGQEKNEMELGREQVEKAADIQGGIVFKKVGDIELVLDIFTPKGRDKSATKMATVIFVHGGGWYMNTRDEMYAHRFAAMVAKLMAKDMAVVSFDYRLVAVPNMHWKPDREKHLVAAEHTYEKIIADCKDLVRWLHKNGEQYNLDTERMATWGGSAGGHLSLMMGLTGPAEFLGDPELAKYRSDIKCLVSWYGTTDFVGQDESMKNRKGGRVPPLLGGTPEEKPEDYKKAGPINYLEKDSIPILLLHGTVDPVVPYAQSVLLADKAKDIGADAEFVTVDPAGHNFAPKGEMKPTLDEIHDLTVKFIIENLGASN